MKAAISKHTVTPYDMCIGVVTSYHFLEARDSPFRLTVQREGYKLDLEKVQFDIRVLSKKVHIPLTAWDTIS